MAKQDALHKSKASQPIGEEGCEPRVHPYHSTREEKVAWVKHQRSRWLTTGGDVDEDVVSELAHEAKAAGLYSHKTTVGDVRWSLRRLIDQLRTTNS